MNSSGRKMDLYRSNGVPHAYSDMAEEVQRGRDAKIAHLLKQVHLPKSGFFYHEQNARKAEPDVDFGQRRRF